MSRERWRKVPGWPYEASSLGHIRREGNSEVLAPEVSDGYERYTLSNGKRRKRFGGHQLVALAFHGPPEVRHRNGDRRDNRPENLLYGSHKDNEHDKWDLGSILAGRPGLNEVEIEGEEGKAEEGIRTDVSRPGKAVTAVTCEAGRS